MQIKRALHPQPDEIPAADAPFGKRHGHKVGTPVEVLVGDRQAFERRRRARRTGQRGGFEDLDKGFIPQQRRVGGPGDHRGKSSAGNLIHDIPVVMPQTTVRSNDGML